MKGKRKEKKGLIKRWEFVYKLIITLLLARNTEIFRLTFPSDFLSL